MIIQALVKRYEDTQEVPFGWQYRKVDFALNIDSDGNISRQYQLRTTENLNCRLYLFVPESMPTKKRTSSATMVVICADWISRNSNLQRSCIWNCLQIVIRPRLRQ